MQRTSHYHPDYVSPPGETVIEVAAERGLTMTDLATGLDRSGEFVAALARGDQPITPELAIRLEKLVTGFIG